MNSLNTPHTNVTQISNDHQGKQREVQQIMFESALGVGDINLSALQPNFANMNYLHDDVHFQLRSYMIPNRADNLLVGDDLEFAGRITVRNLDTGTEYTYGDLDLTHALLHLNDGLSYLIGPLHADPTPAEDEELNINELFNLFRTKWACLASALPYATLSGIATPEYESLNFLIPTFCAHNGKWIFDETGKIGF